MYKESTVVNEKAISPLVYELLGARRRVQEVSAEILKKTSVTASQCLILWAVYTNPGATQTTLVKMTGIDRSTMADTMGRLLKQGLVSRHHADDERAYAITLTREGRAAYRKISKAK
jgi:DNA-binding MarR family transcriptional regulator